MDKIVVEPQTLSDGSIAYNVTGFLFVEGGLRVRFACVDRKHANALAKQLTRVSWTELPNGLPIHSDSEA